MSACLEALNWIPGCGLPMWAQVLVAAPFVALLSRMVTRMASGLPPHHEAAAARPGIPTHANLIVACSSCGSAAEKQH